MVAIKETTYGPEVSLNFCPNNKIKYSKAMIIGVKKQTKRAGGERKKVMMMT
jgi:hypothetical protein